jgi:histidine triad (HIT) family protein
MEVLGHTLVVPKQHYVSLYDIPSDLLGELMNTCKIISLAYRERIGAVGMNILHAS